MRNAAFPNIRGKTQHRKQPYMVLFDCLSCPVIVNSKVLPAMPAYRSMEKMQELFF